MALPDIVIDLPDEAATTRLAEDVALALRSGDVVTLSGDLGAGKTTFARALLRALANDPDLEVPSPTFTLVQLYGEGRLPVAHFDLYRLSAPEELDETGFDEALEAGAVLVEWPERALSRMPGERLDLAFAISGAGRSVRVSGEGPLADRFTRSRVIRAFLDEAGWNDAARRFLQGDASTRAYERVAVSGRRAVLMDWPPPALKPVPKERRFIYRAEDVRPFLAADTALREAGFSAPEIHATDLSAGLLLMEDLGAEGVVSDGTPIPERYHAAVAVLAALHSKPRPRDLPLPDGTVHRLPVLGIEALTAEAEMLLDWYVPHVAGKPAGESARAAFLAIWRPLLEKVADDEQSWALLDYHSPNLIWLPDREGMKQVGLLDFQDMHLGPTAYDVASLAQDARVTVPSGLERDLIARYIALRQAGPGAFQAVSFAESYAILAAQRATRILGIFARLADRDGKPGYLKHMPRLRDYLARTLQHPVLSGLSVWYEEQNLP